MNKLIALCFLPLLSMAQFSYPESKKINHTDTYHGVSISDPYRWLEDDRSAKTGEWVKAQNIFTQDYLSKIPNIDKLKARLEQIYNYPKFSAPSKKADYFYFYKNNGLQNQSVLYRQKGEKGEIETVLDPNSLSKEGTTRLMQFSISKDGRFGAYALSEGGSDWQTIQILDLNSLKPLNDKISWVKVSGIAWQGQGFYYSKYPQPEGSALAAKNENHQVFYHKLNTPQAEDKLVFEDAKNPQRFHTVSTSEDEQFAYLTVSDRGKGLDGNALFYKKRDQDTFIPIKENVNNFSYSVVENLGEKLIIQTNENAANEKLLMYDIAKKTFSPFIKERPEPIQSVSSAGGKLFISYLKDVVSQVEIYNLNSKFEKVIKLPGLGTTSGFGGDLKDTFVFYTFTSFTVPPSIFKYEIASGKSTLFRAAEVDFQPADFETKQVFFASKDGTKVPMFITFKKGIQLNSQNPTLLYGYGGFNISLNPSFSALLIPFLEQGGVFAQANLRGGSEYGEKWHEAGMKLKKQNVFDDFIAAAKYLKAQKYCDSKHLALRGGSNGGLLVGAVVNQRPELAAVAIPQVGVMDMLRFQKFTIGWNWVADYGSSDNAQEFEYLKNYSPLHNIKSGVNYPATLVTTADHDDRVVPAHSFKYAAALQATAGPSTKNPLLIRIDTNSGHGASNTQKNIASTAEIYGFILHNMGLSIK
jgi:prolyl oligopeptidase